MAQAFKCDKCGNLREGEPKKLTINAFAFIDKDSDGTFTARMNFDDNWDLCEECFNKVKEFVTKQEIVK